jgi:hypothetical protein
MGANPLRFAIRLTCAKFEIELLFVFICEKPFGVCTKPIHVLRMEESAPLLGGDAFTLGLEAVNRCHLGIPLASLLLDVPLEQCCFRCF